ncbi:MAG: tRNA (N6-isopentenyl adenosine(37)-C2)-methylthiotransferase MiaB [Candidatus Pelagibacter sp.]|nr:tRNA (N6-isopentenyl adenosine(37)-C2)-methylthiotransferase MiaB [Candidatus Pelagibacter sp.]MAJ85949.1 tRNA (N6-isopentenyl adenosine(37)-C2)-methylthiotransferase MiaB [Candidatus Pelagibacter sp.]OUW23990.1 MAG: tRNA (N6-isopentenyl adenosine(37)-C2)-methylthiotransferase MiaB [Rickettsiales bacterium TMED174]OUW24421.1 MAG: tRNA (N6-isopentenyl adenosine(37)-C2)-methylthiotransferase MiaB [Rickettsiales bacterium TMED174]|tara:strand:- start:235 stop:1593 length:1359 start_codon:yes stop_codon:yes gene_type:complete
MAQNLENKLPKKIFIKTFGCQMNEYDSDRIRDITEKNGFTTSNDIKKSDCFIINTCHIREKATEKVFHEIGRIKKIFRNKKKPLIIVTGCVAQAEGEVLLSREKYIDAIVGPQSYQKINKVIENLEKRKSKIDETKFDVMDKFDQLHFVKNKNNKVSSFITIQEGCDKFCKFCVVPYTRGPENSRSIEHIISEANTLVSNGSKEITLLGQNVNAYNYKEKRLSFLINELEKIKNLERIRYTTSHPNDMTQDLIKMYSTSKKLMPLLHLPVQSGSNKILKLMNRKHDVNFYLNIISQLKKNNINMKFSSDFIIGYPGETKEDFNASIELLLKVNFIQTFSFVYSPRPGTPASNAKQFELVENKKRLMQFQKIATQIKTDYRKNLVGTSAKTLFENKLPNQNKYFGRDEYSNSVIVESNDNLVGRIANVKILKANNQTLFGEKIGIKNEREFAA